MRKVREGWVEFWFLLFRVKSLGVRVLDGNVGGVVDRG